MKKILILLLLIFTISSFAKGYKVAIFDYDLRDKDEYTISKHIKQSLLNTQLEFKKIEEFSGLSDDYISLELLQELESNNYDLIITITSDAMIPASHRIKKTPWLFTNINNPKFFGIHNLNKPGLNKSGVTYYVPVKEQLKLFKKIMNGKLNKIGLIFDINARSKQAEIREFRRMASSLDLDYAVDLIQSKYYLKESVKNLLKKNVDAIVLTSSDKIYNNIDTILELCNSKNIPIFSVNKKAVKNGAIASYASDYHIMVDEALIPMAIDVLKNKKNPGDIPIRSLTQPHIYLNLSQAKKLGIDISKELIDKASKVF